jgi:hypothetical protein
MENNPETIKENNRRWRMNNREHIRNYRNQPKIKAKENKWCRNYRQSLAGRFSKLKTNAKQRGLIVEIGFEEYKKIVSEKCYLCGGETLSLKSGHGVDRLDNSQGYIFENCRPCCGVCNKMKMDMSLEVFITNIKRIVKNYENY